MVRAFWMSQIVGTFARLAIPDRLTDGPLTAGELARLIACHPGATYRLMRAAKELRLVVATPDDRFSLTALGEILRSNVQGSMRDAAIALTAPGHWLPWGRLCEAVRTGRCQTTETLALSSFNITPKILLKVARSPAQCLYRPPKWRTKSHECSTPPRRSVWLISVVLPGP